MRYTLLLALVFVLTFAACGSAEPPVATATIYAMDTVMTLTIYGDNADAALRDAAAEIHRLDALFSPTRADSDIARLNRANGKAVAVSADTIALLTRAMDIWGETDGAFSPLLYPVMRAWGFISPTDHRVPSTTELADLLAYTNVADISIDGQLVTLSLGMGVDLGGIAKGYLGDRLRTIMADMNVDSAIFNLGGEVITIGARPDGGVFRVAVRDPFSDGHIAILQVSNTAVFTSGIYERRFTAEDGTVYHHILDPSTGHPVDNGLVSVTVITTDATRGDALATALLVMGLDQGLAFAGQDEGIEAIFVTTEGGVYTSCDALVCCIIGI